MNQNAEHLSDETFSQNIIQGARSIQPDAAFASNLEHTLMQSVSVQKQNQKSSQRLIRILGTMAAGLMIAFIAIFNVPSLRAIAEEIIGLLTRSTRDETTGYYIEQPAVQLFASLEKAETDLARDFVVPQYLPSVTMANKDIPVEFQMLYYTPEIESVQIMYTFAPNSDWALTFRQTPSEIYHERGGTSVGASAEIEPVTFNFRGQLVSAQFVKGSWWAQIDVEDIQELEALQTATPTSFDLKWSTETGGMYLIWEADGVVYHFITSESRLLEINRDELVRIAESIE